MKHEGFILFIMMLFVLSSFNVSYSQDDQRIWKEFIIILKAGKMTTERIRPLPTLGEKYKPILLGYLDSVRIQATDEDWNTQPEIVRSENRVQFILPWTTGTQKVTYCFSFVTDSSAWYFQHLEAIFIRLDKVTEFPTSTFPDVSEQMKAWAREEIYWSFVVLNLYLPITRERGKEAALNHLKDGGGYLVGAQTWVPFSSSHKAFVLYLCWEQAHLRGNQVTLVKLEDDDAIVKMSTHFFSLYFITSHLKSIISLADYTSIFETIWKDRASNAGWDIEINYTDDYQVTFHLTRID